MTVPPLSVQAGGEENRLTPNSAIATISSLFCELEIVSGEHPLGTILKSKIGDAILLRSTIHAGQFVTARSERMIRGSTTDDFLLGMVVRGNPSIYQESREARLAAGEMILIDSRRKYELQIADAVELVCLKLPRRLVESKIVEHGRYLGLALRTDHGLGHIAARMLEACISTASFLNRSDGRRFESSFVDMIGSAFRCQVGDEESPSVWHAYKVFNRVQEYLERNLADPLLGPSMVSENTGLSERYVRKLFAARGTTLMAWIRSNRLHKCHQALNGGSGDYASIAEIAFAHGFNDISSFNRSFKSEFGVTPGDVRLATRVAKSSLDALH